MKWYSLIVLFGCCLSVVSVIDMKELGMTASFVMIGIGIGLMFLGNFLSDKFE